MTEREFGPEEGPLLRTRLHIRGGKRRLRQGKIAAGIVTLYDALNGALEWYIASSERRKNLVMEKVADLNDNRIVYEILVRSNVLDGGFDFDAFDRLVERALKEEMSDYDYREMLKGIDNVMTQLGVIPFDESALPPEHPMTY
jgi:hypothetical protein